jgi:hypothetical protein
MGIPSFLIKYCNASAPAYYDSIWFVTRTRHSRSDLLNRIFITRGRRTVYSSNAQLIKEAVHPLPSHYNKNKHSLRGFISASGAMLILYQPKKNPLYRSRNSHHKQNHNSHVNKFSSLPFVAVITNREAYRCSARNSSGAARPCGAAAPRNGDAHSARLRSEGSLLLSDVPSVHAKMAKDALLTAARAEVPDHAARAESSDSTHHLKHALFARVSRCVRSCE